MMRVMLIAQKSNGMSDYIYTVKELPLINAGI